ncbi:MAG: hypothetical protein U1F43_16590 [Myxococcota bacterium]
MTRTSIVVVCLVAACGDDHSIGQRAVRCGDGVVQTGEGCDLGAANSNAPDAACRIDCQPRRCGDGIVDTAAGEACDGVSEDACGCRAGCVFEPATTVCRASVGACDADDTCDGAGLCRGDGKRVGTTCRASTGPCDAAERCSGESDACPDDVVASAGTACRPAASECDVAELCDGVTGACGQDEVVADGTPCDDGCVDDCLCHAGLCAPHCGNGNVDAALGESCDDGAANGSLGLCTTSCAGSCEPTGAHGWPLPSSLAPYDLAVAPDGRRYLVGLQSQRTPQPPIGDAPQIVRDFQGDAVLVALDEDDHVAWSQCIASGLGQDILLQAAADPEGVVVAGNVSPGARIGCCGDADPSACAEVVPSDGEVSFVIARLDRSGAMVWKLFSPFIAVIRRLAIAPGGDAIVVGGVSSVGKIAFGAAQGVPQVGDPPKASDLDGFIVRIGKGGTPRWVRLIGSPLYDRVEDVAVRPDGGLVLHLTLQGDVHWLGHDFLDTPDHTRDELVEVDPDATRITGVQKFDGGRFGIELRRIVATRDGVWLTVIDTGPVSLDLGGPAPLELAGPATYVLRLDELGGGAAPDVFGPVPGFSSSTSDLAASPDGVVLTATLSGDVDLPGLGGPRPTTAKTIVLMAARGSSGLVARWLSAAGGFLANPSRGFGVDARGRVSLLASSASLPTWGPLALGPTGSLVTLDLPAGCGGCGDGLRAGQEVCDDGDQSDCSGTCDALCLGPVNACGDGVARCGESLDPGGGAQPTGTCGGCGNGILTAGEACDGGVLGARDGCTLSCDARCDVVARWTSVIGGPSDGVENDGVTALPDGGALVSAQFHGSTSLTMADGSVQLLHAHDQFDIDSLLYRLDPDGKPRWVTCFGSAVDFAEATPEMRLAKDGFWVFGNTRSLIEDFCCPDLDPPAGAPRSCDTDIQHGTDTLGGHPAFLARYDLDGHFQLARGGSTQLLDAGVDQAGDIIAAGADAGTLAVRWAGMDELPAPQGNDLTLLSLATDGTLRWFHTFAQAGNQAPEALAVDPADGSSWVVGSINGGGFTLGADSIPDVGANPRAFIAAFDASGAPRWLRSPSELTPPSASGVTGLVRACRADDDCALFTSVSRTLAENETILTIVRMDLDGQVQKTVDIHGDASPAGNVEIRSLGVDRRHRLTVIGDFSAQLAFAGGPALVPTSAADAYDATDIFIARADWDLGWLWARAAGGPDYELTRHSALAADGGVLVGWFPRALESDLVVDGVTAHDVEDRGVVTRFVPREEGCAVCGDDVVGPGETCDDGGTDDCSGTCDAQCSGATGGASCAP